MIIAGVDYSITSPAMCIHYGNEWNINNCIFYYFDDKINTYKNFYALEYPEWTVDIERYVKIADIFLDFLSLCDYIGIEGYAYAGKGRVFSMAEHTGILKYKLYSLGINYTIYPPPVIKKFATNKGNCDKDLLEEHFDKEGLDDSIRDILKMSHAPKSRYYTPISDIVDSYYVAKYTFYDIMEERDAS